MSTPKSGYFQWTPETSQQTLSAASTYFHENGFAVLKSHATPEETATLRAAASRIISNYYQSNAPSKIFSTTLQNRIMDDTYFLNSVNNISCFIEAQEPCEKPAINKIGHALHDLEPSFSKFSYAGKVRDVAKDFGMLSPVLIQSMYILKSARKGSAVVPHRDATFVRGDSCAIGDCLGFWWALEDATLENGCLWAIPRSHTDEISRRFVLVDNGTRTEFIGEDDILKYRDDDYVPLPVDAGDLVMIHGGLVHKSNPNFSDKSRHAYSIHVVERSVRKDCWLRRRDDFPVKPL